MTSDETDPVTVPQQATVAGVLYLGFSVGSELYGLPLTRLGEVARLTRVRRIPGAAAHVAGLVNLRGEIIWALESRAILGLDPAASAPSRHLIALQGFSFPIGLIVDAVSDIFSVTPDTVDEVPPSWRSARAACATGTCQVGRQVAGLLDVDRVVNQ